MILKLDSLKTDVRRAKDGEWIECPELGEGVALKVRSLDYAPFKVALRQAQLRFARIYPGDKIPPPDEEDAKNGELYAEHLLLGWRGFPEDPYSPELAREALTDVSHRALRAAVASCARQVGELKVEQAETIAGNSKPVSGGASSAGETTTS